MKRAYSCDEFDFMLMLRRLSIIVYVIISSQYLHPNKYDMITLRFN